MSDARAGGGVRLTCNPSKSGNVLLFPYTVENQGAGDIYAAHAMPGAAAPNDTAAVVMAGDGGDAIIGKFATPLPTDRRIFLPQSPLARRLPPGASLEGRIEIPLPLAETSPYFPDLTLRQYEIVELKGVIVTIGYWPAETTDLIARPAPNAPDLLTIITADPVGSAKLASQRFPTNALQLFRRKDAFSRMLG
jgi:hypothetical protein